MPICTKCGKEKPKNKFLPDRRYNSGFQPYCGECRRTYKREWMRENFDYHGKYDPEKYDRKKRHAHNIAQKLPINRLCELCPDNDKQFATDRHHPDYNYPEIFVSVCSECHSWIRKECVP